MNMFQSEHRLRVLHIILSLRPTNGQYNEHCLPLRRIRDITICTYFKSEITPPPEIVLFDGDNTVRGFFRALRAALDKREYDIIHVHTPHAGVLVMMGLFFFGLYRKLKPSTVHTIQNSFNNFSFRNKMLFIPSFPLFQRLIFCSHASYASFPSLLKWMGGSRLRVVQNAVDLERIDLMLAAAQPVHSSQFTITTIGLIKMKNPFTMLDAFRQSNNQSSKLIFIGEGTLRPSLTKTVAKSELQQQVSFTGLIERDNVFANFAKADLFVSTSWGEGLPVAVMEAMACRLPVILSDIPPHREIAEGVDFIPLVKPDDVDGFAKEINRFQEMTISERTVVGQQCRELIEDRFSLPVMHEGISEVYAEITGGQVPSLVMATESANVH